MVTNKYRSHKCGQLRETDIDKTVRLSGWLWRKRNLGKLVFIDLKDQSGVSQCVSESGSAVAE
ncbi:MAG: OB-fold nucleic acid binding domain-containing protein, partial [Myxococcota bacterium]